MKVGLFFGTFDPIHNGHLKIVNEVHKSGFVKKILLVVTPQSPFKVNNTNLEKSLSKKGLNLKELSNDELKAFALILGSDCPLFIDNNPQYGEGRGEVLSPVNIDLTGKYLLLVYPGIHVSSKGAYSNVIPKVSRSCKKAIESDIKSWRFDLVNDFEAYVIPNYPELAGIKDPTRYKN